MMSLVWPIYTWAYWVVNTVRYQLKNKGITIHWQEIVRIANTQKMITSTAKNTKGQEVCIRKCSEPESKIKQLYEGLNYKFCPFIKRKFVGLKVEQGNQKNVILQNFQSG